jgi:hypothetical protein
VALRSGNLYRHLNNCDDRSYLEANARHMLCSWCWSDQTTITTVDYDENTLAALDRIKDSYLELNRRVGGLLKLDNIHRLGENIKNLLPETPKNNENICIKNKS